MKVLFDEEVPHKLVPLLPQHDIQAVVSMKWGGIRNGALLTLIERERFQALLTGDKNIETQQRLEGRPSAVLIMSAINWPVVRPHVHKIAAALDAARPGTVAIIDCGVFKPRSKPQVEQSPRADCLTKTWCHPHLSDGSRGTSAAGEIQYEGDAVPRGGV